MTEIRIASSVNIRLYNCNSSVLKNGTACPMCLQNNIQSSWDFVGSLLETIPKERDPYWVTLIKFWKQWLFLTMSLSRDMAKMWPTPIFLKFDVDLDVDLVHQKLILGWKRQPDSLVPFLDKFLTLRSAAYAFGKFSEIIDDHRWLVDDRILIEINGDDHRWLIYDHRNLWSSMINDYNRCFLKTRF